MPAVALVVSGCSDPLSVTVDDEASVSAATTRVDPGGRREQIRATLALLVAAVPPALYAATRDRVRGLRTP